MSLRLLKMAHAADGRYFQAEERRAILSFAQSLPGRVGLAESIEQQEEAVLRGVVEDLQKRYPNFSKFHDQGWARCFRDLQLVLRQDVQSMILDDVASLDDKVLLWLRTIFAANNYTPQFCRDCFTLLRERLQQQLARDTFESLRPYLDRNIEVLSDFPEPATPAV